MFVSIFLIKEKDDFHVIFVSKLVSVYSELFTSNLADFIL